MSSLNEWHKKLMETKEKIESNEKQNEEIIQRSKEMREKITDIKKEMEGK